MVQQKCLCTNHVCLCQGSGGQTFVFLLGMLLSTKCELKHIFQGVCTLFNSSSVNGLCISFIHFPIGSLLFVPHFLGALLSLARLAIVCDRSACFLSPLILSLLCSGLEDFLFYIVTSFFPFQFFGFGVVSTLWSDGCFTHIYFSFSNTKVCSCLCHTVIAQCEWLLWFITF